MKVKELNRTQWTFSDEIEREMDFDLIKMAYLNNDGMMNCLVGRISIDDLLFIGVFKMPESAVLVYGEREL